MNLEVRQQEFVKQFNDWVWAYISQCRQDKNFSQMLLNSQEYSMLSGGKRFRPFLTTLVFELFSQDLVKIKNFCLALEMIHTYSLIHDDLPCMDDDDLRRGKPTNHKVFSEDIALLAGDGLLTDVFFLISSDVHLNDQVKVKLIKLVSEKVGSRGMVSGQVLDMQANKDVTFDELRKIHTLKTANLIQVAALGAALISESEDSDAFNISQYGFHLGMAFQIKDDLLDEADKDQGFKSYLSLLGSEKTDSELSHHSEQAQKYLTALNGKNIKFLAELVKFNLQRRS